jgi:hypothetical protein
MDAWDGRRGKFGVTRPVAIHSKLQCIAILLNSLTPTKNHLLMILVTHERRAFSRRLGHNLAMLDPPLA